MQEREVGFFDASGKEENLTPEERRKIFRDFLMGGAKEELDRSDRVYRECKYVRFTSYSKGRGKLRRSPREVELFQYSGRWRMIVNEVETKDIDEIATEVLGESVLPQECTETFLEKLRQLGR